MIRLIRLLVFAVLIFLVVSQAAQASSWPALDRIASEATGQPVDVTCATADDPSEAPLVLDWMPARMWAYTYPGARSQVIVSQLMCAGLLFALTDPQGKNRWQLYTYHTAGYGTTNDIVEGFAIHGFTHELRHVTVGYSLFTGATDDLARTEHDAECYATSHDTEMAVRFGLTSERAELMHLGGMAYHSLLPLMYRDGVCP